MLTLLAVDVTYLVYFGVYMYILTIEYLSGKVVDGEKQYRLTTVQTDLEDYKSFLDDQFTDYFILDVEEIDD